MSVDRAEVVRIAQLARLDVPEEDLDRLAGELNNILDWIEQLNEVDTDDVAPVASVADQKLRWRPDVVTDGGIADDVVSNAPDGNETFFAVPKVVE